MAILERALVRAIENMDDETFVKHMEARHGDSLGYMIGLKTILSDHHLLRLWQLYHMQLHRFRIDLKHEHGEP
jgi:hypothetical protein